MTVLYLFYEDIRYLLEQQVLKVKVLP